MAGVEGPPREGKEKAPLQELSVTPGSVVLWCSGCSWKPGVRMEGGALQGWKSGEVEDMGHTEKFQGASQLLFQRWSRDE